ncbi:hypothetical protein SLEP1_g28810 [Rubroshorea leprosula]|uniref:Uncharacterized protein n=1 Tax=Rubroshorea leprosula TaxID=152421 RepID=A0AAV5K3H6_9ROSI|nr:hypothetical protein SLEP1_g28810 [Rubroshorea leprosula]
MLLKVHLILPPTRSLGLVATRGPEVGSTFSNKRHVAESARGDQKRDTFNNLSLVAESARGCRSNKRLVAESARGDQKRDTFSNMPLVAESARGGRSWEHFQQQEVIKRETLSATCPLLLKVNFSNKELVAEKWSSFKWPRIDRKISTRWSMLLSATRSVLVKVG